VPVNWKYGIGPVGVEGPIEVPYGSLFGADGVAMQGSGKVTIEKIDPLTGEKHEETMYFELDNGRELHWVNGNGELTQWENDHWTNGSPAQIGNPEDAVFRPVSKATGLT
jgi:hypothetical protein